MGKEWMVEILLLGQILGNSHTTYLSPVGIYFSLVRPETTTKNVAIEDAGFEIRDQIMWIYGSGFPKSHNIGKS